jgi:hypothetical protein
VDISAAVVHALDRKGLSMHHQRSLPMTPEAALEALWDRFSERSRNEVVALYADIIARSVKPSALPEKEEETQDEDPHR